MREQREFFHGGPRMSANNYDAELGYNSGYSAPAVFRARGSPGMEVPPSQYSSNSQSNPATAGSSMAATATLAVQNPMPPVARNSYWNDRASMERSQLPTEKIELPSIRQVLPDIQLSNVRVSEAEYRAGTPSNSPPAGPRAQAAPFDYVQSPSQHKRRRLSSEAEYDHARESAVPESYRSPPYGPSRGHSVLSSPTPSARRLSLLSTTESRSTSTRSSPYSPPRGTAGARSPPPFDSLNITRSEWRPTLPSLPSLSIDRPGSQAKQGQKARLEYALETSRLGAQHFPQPPTSYDPPPSFYQVPQSHGYEQPPVQSYSGAPATTQERTPFLNNSQASYPAGNFPHAMDANEGSEGKQRKRRGNLPKETTDKLRSWFLTHLQHPYPTEDEKQDLMRQTGLQMNQISNWFINARRRQLPTMINNARAESDAISARVGDNVEGTNGFVDGERKSPDLH